MARQQIEGLDSMRRAVYSYPEYLLIRGQLKVGPEAWTSIFEEALLKPEARSTPELIKTTLEFIQSRVTILDTELNVQSYFNRCCAFKIKDAHLDVFLNQLKESERELFLMSVFRATELTNSNEISLNDKSILRRMALEKLSKIETLPLDVYLQLIGSENEFRNQLLKSVFGDFSNRIRPENADQAIASIKDIPLSDIYKIAVGSRQGALPASRQTIMLQMLAKTQSDLGDGVRDVLERSTHDSSEILKTTEKIERLLSEKPRDWSESDYIRDQIRDCMERLSRSEKEVILLRMITRGTQILDPMIHLRAISFWAELVGEHDTELLSDAINNNPQISGFYNNEEGFEKFIVDAKKIAEHTPTSRLKWLIEYYELRKTGNKRGFRAIDISARANLVITTLLSGSTPINQREDENDLIIERFSWNLDRAIIAIEKDIKTSERGLLRRSANLINVILGQDFSGFEINEYKSLMELLDIVLSLSETQSLKAVEILVNRLKGKSDELCAILSKMIANVAAINIEDRVNKFLAFNKSIYDQPESDLQGLLERDSEKIMIARNFLFQVHEELTKKGGPEIEIPSLYFEEALNQMDQIIRINTYQQGLVLKIGKAVSTKGTEEGARLAVATIEEEMIQAATSLSDLLSLSVLEEIMDNRLGFNPSELSRRIIDVAITYRFGSRRKVGEAMLARLMERFSEMAKGGKYGDELHQLMSHLAFNCRRFAIIGELSRTVQLAIGDLTLYNTLDEEYTSQKETEDLLLQSAGVIVVTAGTFNPGHYFHGEIIKRFLHLAASLQRGEPIVAVVLGRGESKRGKLVSPLESREKWMKILLSHLRSEVLVNNDQFYVKGGDDKGIGAKILSEKFPDKQIIIACGSDKIVFFLHTDDPKSYSEISQFIVLRKGDKVDWDLIGMYLGVCKNVIFADLSGGESSSTLVDKITRNGWGSEFLTLLIGQEAAIVAEEFAKVTQ